MAGQLHTGRGDSGMQFNWWATQPEPVPTHCAQRRRRDRPWICADVTCKLRFEQHAWSVLLKTVARRRSPMRSLLAIHMRSERIYHARKMAARGHPWPRAVRSRWVYLLSEAAGGGQTHDGAREWQRATSSFGRRRMWCKRGAMPRRSMQLH
jgi:hypothetical protein